MLERFRSGDALLGVVREHGVQEIEAELRYRSDFLAEVVVGLVLREADVLRVG